MCYREYWGKKMSVHELSAKCFESFIKKPISEMADRYHYPDFAKMIISGDIEKAKMSDPMQWSNILSQIGHMDTRSPEEYAQDIASMWVVEDSFREIARKALGIDLRRSGMDNDRTFCQNKKMSAAPDFTMDWNGIEYGVEFVSTVSNKVNDCGSFKLRMTKADNLIKNKCLLIIWDFFNFKMILIDPLDRTNRIERCDRTFGNENGSRVYVNPSMEFSPMDTHQFTYKMSIIEEGRQSMAY